jgi:hypothetical protein
VTTNDAEGTLIELVIKGNGTRATGRRKSLAWYPIPTGTYLAVREATIWFSVRLNICTAFNVVTLTSTATEEPLISNNLRFAAPPAEGKIAQEATP